MSFITPNNASEKTYGNVVIDSVVAIYDGDAFTASIVGWPAIADDRISVRIFGIDTPEMRDKRPEEKAKAQQTNQYVIKRLREVLTQKI